MYTLAVRRDFTSRHALIGGDWGQENLPHSHRYLLELQLSGNELNEHGFLVDIVDVHKCLDAVIGRYRDQFLNDFPEFAGLNPSLENFARILAVDLGARIRSTNVAALKVALWEDETAWAAYVARE